MTFATNNVVLFIATLFFGVVAYRLAIARIKSRIAVDGVKSHS